MAGKTGPKSVATRKRAAAALELRIAGKRYQDIADELGYWGRGDAYKAITGLLNRVESDAADEIRKLEGVRLDKMLQGVWWGATHGDAVAIRSVISIMERRARLFGLDLGLQQEVNAMVQAISVTINYGEDWRGREVEEGEVVTPELPANSGENGDG